MLLCFRVILVGCQSDDDGLLATGLLPTRDPFSEGMSQEWKDTEGLIVMGTESREKFLGCSDVQSMYVLYLSISFSFFLFKIKFIEVALVGF